MLEKENDKIIKPLLSISCVINIEIEGVLSPLRPNRYQICLFLFLFLSRPLSSTRMNTPFAIVPWNSLFWAG